MHKRTNDLLNTIADHLSGLSTAIRALAHEETIADEYAISSDKGPKAASFVDPGEAVAKARSLHPLLGSHQQLVIQALAHAYPEGLSAPQINPNTSTQPNTYMTCDKLEVLGLIRCDTGTHPKRYYLGPRMFD
jgi:hypothetical protein